jgi:hypothetical protein
MVVPSSTDPNGGKNFHVYAESTSGGPLQCFVDENVDTSVDGGDTKRNRTPAAALFLILGTDPFCASKCLR